ncbi:MAG: hypothetical protein P8N09_07255 [Planctomycetota bacterium]|nr:hypothetical protein [Planctomycetota bacterium]
MSITKSFIPLFVALLASTAMADELHLYDGRHIDQAVVKSESFSKVEYRRKSVTQKVDSKEIRSIVYGRTSPEYKAGLAALAEGNSMAAAQNFIAAAEDEGLPDGIRASAYIECGESLLANNNFAESLEIFTELLSTYPETRHYARALLGKGRAQFFTRQLGDAAATFSELQNDVKTKDLGEVWGLEAEFALLWAKEAQGEAGVLDGYRALRARAREDFPAVANQCSLRMGRVYLGNDEVGQALPLFDEIIESRLTTDSSIVAGAYNGRGRALFWEGRNELKEASEAEERKDLEAATAHLEDALAAFRAARLDFLRVQTMFRGVAREQPESLYWAAQSFLNVASLADDLGLEEEDAERMGRILLKRCAERFPQSDWGSRAAEEI